MDDLISRQQAIEKFAMTAPQMSTIHIYEAVDILDSLPTVQKKIVKCKDCRWWKKMKSSGQGRCKLLGIYPTGGWYCANGCVQKEKT